jgi:hypothetical protein
MRASSLNLFVLPPFNSHVLQVVFFSPVEDARGLTYVSHRVWCPADMAEWIDRPARPQYLLISSVVRSGISKIDGVCNPTDSFKLSTGERTSVACTKRCHLDGGLPRLRLKNVTSSNAIKSAMLDVHHGPGTAARTAAVRALFERNGAKPTSRQLMALGERPPPANAGNAATAGSSSRKMPAEQAANFDMFCKFVDDLAPAEGTMATSNVVLADWHLRPYNVVFMWRPNKNHTGWSPSPTALFTTIQKGLVQWGALRSRAAPQMYPCPNDKGCAVIYWDSAEKIKAPSTRSGFRADFDPARDASYMYCHYCCCHCHAHHRQCHLLPSSIFYFPSLCAFSVRTAMPSNPPVKRKRPAADSGN